MLTDELLETELRLSPADKWRISSGEISKRELEELLPATVQGSYINPRIAKHIPFHHRPVRDNYLSYIIRTFIQKLSLTQNIVANDHDVARFATGEWAPTLEDFRYDWTQSTTAGLNAEAVRVITEGILGDFTAGNYLETALDGAPTFPELNGKVKTHIRYLTKKIKKVNSETDGDIETDIPARSKARRCHRRRQVRAAHWITVTHPSHARCRNSCGGLVLQITLRPTGGPSSLSCRELVKIICLMRRVTGI